MSREAATIIVAGRITQMYFCLLQVYLFSVQNVFLQYVLLFEVDG